LLRKSTTVNQQLIGQGWPVKINQGLAVNWWSCKVCSKAANTASQ